MKIKNDENGKLVYAYLLVVRTHFGIVKYYNANVLEFFYIIIFYFLYIYIF